MDLCTHGNSTKCLSNIYRYWRLFRPAARQCASGGFIPF
jgi:hypothetical protein